MIRAHQPVPNAMTWGDYYDRAYGPIEAKCYFCKEEYYCDEMKEFCDGLICPDCALECCWCGDWIANQPEVLINGNRYHKACAKDAGVEDEDTRQAVYDAYIDSQMEERKENRRAS